MSCDVRPVCDQAGTSGPRRASLDAGDYSRISPASTNPPIVVKKIFSEFWGRAKSFSTNARVVDKLRKLVDKLSLYVEENNMQTKKLLPLTSERLEKLLKHQTAMLAAKEQANKQGAKR